MDSNNLAQIPSNNKISKQSSEDSRAVLCEWLVVTASVMNKDFTKAEAQLWGELVGHYPAAKIEKAFREYLREGKFFPKPADIIERIREYILDEQPSPAEKVRMELAEYDAKRKQKEQKNGEV